jgi:signal transduction histidine kinase
METAIFRIIQEAVTNVFRHSGAREAWVTLIREDDLVTGTVRDNGKGLADGIMEGKPDRIGVGIGGMRQRVKEFGGDLRIANARPGTIVEVSVPIESMPEDSPSSNHRMEKTARRQVAY